MEHDLSGDEEEEEGEEEARGKNGGREGRRKGQDAGGGRDLQPRRKDSSPLFALKGRCLPYQVALFFRIPSFP